MVLFVDWYYVNYCRWVFVAVVIYHTFCRFVVIVTVENFVAFKRELDDCVVHDKE